MTGLQTAQVDSWHARGAADDLSTDECWRRLARQHRGRIALSEGDLPAIYPVDYVATTSALVFRTAENERLRRFANDARIAFEVGVELERELWSVMLLGTARQLDPAPVSAWVAMFPARPATETYVYVYVEPADIRGRVWDASNDLDLVLRPTD